jgi:hypothetical protein
LTSARASQLTMPHLLRVTLDCAAPANDTRPSYLRPVGVFGLNGE